MSEVKTFLNPNVIKVNVQDTNNDVHEFIAKTFTIEASEQLTKIANKAAKSKGKDADKYLYEMMAHIFGKDEKFYKGFTVSVLTKVLNYFTKEFKNPIKGT